MSWVTSAPGLPPRAAECRHRQRRRNSWARSSQDLQDFAEDPWRQEGVPAKVQPGGECSPARDIGGAGHPHVGLQGGREARRPLEGNRPGAQASPQLPPALTLCMPGRQRCRSVSGSSKVCAMRSGAAPCRAPIPGGACKDGGRERACKLKGCCSAAGDPRAVHRHELANPSLPGHAGSLEALSLSGRQRFTRESRRGAQRSGAPAGERALRRRHRPAAKRVPRRML